MTTTLSATGQAGTRTSGRHLGLALLVIATAQLMVVLDATIVIVEARARGRLRPGLPGRRRDRRGNSRGRDHSPRR
jgi:hypothetical protein